MEKKKIDKVIEAFRNYINLKEDGAIGSAPTNSVGDGGLTSKGQKLAGFDPVMGIRRRKGPQIKLPAGSRKRWMDK